MFFLIQSQLVKIGQYTSECDTFIKNQMHYILGDTGRSYVVGFGNNPPNKPHHRSSSCPDMPRMFRQTVSAHISNTMTNNFCRKM
jgi:hypothetical protein